MRKFSSYGPINKELHYYAPRTALIDFAYRQLLGDDPDKDGHYITVWAPRQTGKTWLMQEVIGQLQASGEFEIGFLSMQSTRSIETDEILLRVFVQKLRDEFGKNFPDLESWAELSNLFTANYFVKPVILLLDEFDALQENFINYFANEFRDMYSQRLRQMERSSGQKSCLLHGLALIGVRSVLGIENVSGSPFNVQRSIHVPNLTQTEVAGMFDWYAQESGQKVEEEVVAEIFNEMRGQPGLTSWLGELLTETYNKHNPSIAEHDFDVAYAAAIHLLPNNNILNIISKANQKTYKPTVLELFKTERKIPFRYDNKQLNFLYLNGVIDWESEDETSFYVRFANPFVQKRLFNYFSDEIFPHLGQLVDPFADLSDVITEQALNLQNLLRQYEQYLQKNRDWLFDGVPRRKIDGRIYEAVYHFNLYLYLTRFLAELDGRVYPEFPTGNGQIDLIIRYAGQMYGLEVKSFVNQLEYTKNLRQAARYGDQLKLNEVTLAFFIDTVDDENRRKFETDYQDSDTSVTVTPLFIVTG
ncbi:AAA-like domain-containing protein [Chloroflexi bacterium TSY]|nr:AAA-like domain-containing protein [Chloroflexi bacterium TSY]